VKAINFLNAALWLVNSVLWAGYAQNYAMAAVSFVAAVGAGWLAVKIDTYY
jgi:hypothetical protein